MRLTLTKMRTLTALFAVGLMVLLSWQHHDAPTVETPHQHSESAILASQHQHRQEAILTDASQIYRICSSRPQRLLSAQGPKTERTVTPFGNFTIRQHIVKHLFSYFDSRCRMETAPFCMSASCDYYVIALRRLLC